MGLIQNYLQPAFNVLWWAGKATGTITEKASSVGPLIAMQYLGRAVWSERNFEAFAREGYQKNLVAYIAIDRLAKSIALPEWTLHKKKSGQRIEQHPLLDLLNKPNPVMNSKRYVYDLAAYRMIAGNAYSEAVGPFRKDAPPRELYVLRPDRMTIKAGTNGLPGSYCYRVGQETREFKVDFIKGTSEILHWKTFHPTNDFYGMSPLEAAAMSVDTHNSGTEWNKALLDNSARPSGALSVKEGGTLGETEFRRLKKEIQEKYTGPSKAGRPMLLEGGLEWVNMSLSPRELEFLEGKNTSAREIAMVYGFPPQLLGIPGDNTYSNLQEARLSLWEDTVIPEREDLNDDLNRWLVPRFGDDLVLSFNVDDIPALALRRQKTYERVQTADFLTVNEKREQVGLDPHDGGDVILQSATMVPLGQDADEDEDIDPAIDDNTPDDDEDE